MIEHQYPNEIAWTDLEAIVGPEYIWPASSTDMIDGLRPSKVVAPGTAPEVAKVLQYCSSAGLAVVPRGGGTKLGLGNRPEKADVILSTERLNRVVEHVWGDMTAIVEAGCTIDSLQRAIQPHRQRLAVDPLWPEKTTIGGLLATAESGTLRIRYGAVRDLVLGVEVALPDGSLIKAGGKVVKNVAGYDLTKLMIGSLGTLGVITRAAFRLHPIPVATASYSITAASAAEATRFVLAILASYVIYTGLQVRTDRADRLTLDVRFEGIPESLQDQRERLAKLLVGSEIVESSDEVWGARRQLFADAGSSAICKCGVLPSQIGSLCDGIFRQTSATETKATIVAQGTGLAEVRLDAGLLSLTKAVIGVRSEVDRLEGSLVVEQCPVSMKESLDVWGTLKDAVALMQQIKGKFDPARTLNPGRFVGAI
jgi:glycolate oxidase FAD binding subunit